MKHIIKVIIPEIVLHERINELGKEITRNYKNANSKILLIGLLRGSFIFIADLCRAIKITHEVDFMTISSYGIDIVSCRDIKILKDVDASIYNKHVLVVEDIIDSGLTLKKVLKILQVREPKSLSVCTLLDKPQHREVTIVADYVGFSIPDGFMVGYGIDYAQRYRHLPYIGKVVFTE
ncbi:MAG: hypoxanthine phosphoribosyltransferase [Buchnera aphidicola (Eriosoma harunire)]